MNTWLSKITNFAKHHPLLAPIMATLFFILFVALTSVYANVLMYDFGSPGSQVTGIGKPVTASQTFVHYDTNHFLVIAENGYKTLNDYAFLPLYPLVIRGVERITPLSYVWSAIISSWVFLCVAAVMMYKWFDLELKFRGKKVSPWLPIGLLAIFPTSLYLAMPYSESLFLFVNVSSLYFYRKGNYWLAALFAALASATRYQGVLLAIFFAADLVFSKKRNYKKLIPAIAAFLGLFGYMIFLKVHTGSPLEFLIAEKQWGRLHGNLLINLIKSLRPIHIWFLIVLAIGLKYIREQLGNAYLLYALAFVLLPLSSGRFEGLNRYMVSLLPLFLSFAMISDKQSSRTVRMAYVMTSVFLAGWSILFFANNYLVG